MNIHDFAGLTGYTLKPLGAADLAAFLELGLPTCAFMHGRPEVSPDKMRPSFTSFVREYAFQPESEIYVVKEPDHGVVAQLWLHLTRNRFNNFHEMWVWDLTVREDHRQRGIGRALLQFARNRAEVKGCEELWLLVSSINDKAVKLYQSVGMRVSGHVMSLDPRRADPAPAVAVHAAALRLLTSADIEQLYRLWEAAGLPCKPEGRDRPDRLGRHLNQDIGGGWGVFEEGMLVAGALYSFDGRKGFIERLATRPDHRRTGQGRAVVKACMESLKRAGALVTAALIEEDNTASRKLFEALGFIDSPTLCYYSIRDSNQA